MQIRARWCWIYKLSEMKKMGSCTEYLRSMYGAAGWHSRVLRTFCPSLRSWGPVEAPVPGRWPVACWRRCKVRLGDNALVDAYWSKIRWYRQRSLSRAFGRRSWETLSRRMQRPMFVHRVAVGKVLGPCLRSRNRGILGSRAFFIRAPKKQNHRACWGGLMPPVHSGRSRVSSLATEEGYWIPNRLCKLWCFCSVSLWITDFRPVELLMNIMNYGHTALRQVRFWVAPG